MWITTCGLTTAFPSFSSFYQLPNVCMSCNVISQSLVLMFCFGHMAKGMSTCLFLWVSTLASHLRQDFLTKWMCCQWPFTLTLNSAPLIREHSLHNLANIHLIFTWSWTTLNHSLEGLHIVHILIANTNNTHHTVQSLLRLNQCAIPKFHSLVLGDS